MLIYYTKHTCRDWRCCLYSRVPSLAVDTDDDNGGDIASSLRDTASSEQRLPSVTTVCRTFSTFHLLSYFSVCCLLTQIPQCRALRLTYDEISWLSVLVGRSLGGWLFYLQMISQDWEGLRMSNLAQRWHLVWGLCARLDFWKFFFNCGWQKADKNRPKKWANNSLRATSATRNSRNAEIGVRMMPKLFVFW